jgi:adenylate cyclase
MFVHIRFHAVSRMPSPGTGSAGAPPPPAIAQALKVEELAGLRLATQVRAVAMPIIGIAMVILQPWPYGGYNGALMLLFAGLGGMHYAAARRFGGAWPAYLFPSLDVVFYVVLLFVINPAMWPLMQATIIYNYGSALFLLVLMAASALSYAVRPLLWFGGFAAAVWFAAFVWVAQQPGAAQALALTQMGGTRLPPDLADGGGGLFWFVAIPRIVEACYFLLGSQVLAVVVWRSRRLVMRQAAAMRERTNLARYFSPNMVEELAQTDEPLGAVRQQDVAVLFIDKYLGDGLMATFGTPWPGPGDAADALSCGIAMAAELQRWNQGRQGTGAPAIAAGIGIHYGPVVVGDMGGEGALEFAVIGDSVNVAARLEALSRSLDADLVISADLAATAQAQGLGRAVLADFQAAPPQTLRNRAAAVEILCRRR